MTAEQLTHEGQQRIAHLLPDAPVEATTFYSHKGRSIFRVRLVTSEVTKDVCSMGDTAKQALTRFAQAVKKYVSMPEHLR